MYMRWKESEGEAGLMIAVFRQTGCEAAGRSDGGGWEVYCSVTFPVSAGGSVHQDIKYATMLTEPVS